MQTNAQTDLAKAYDNGFSSVANTYLDLPAVMSGMQSMLFDNTSFVSIYSKPFL